MLFLGETPRVTGNMWRPRAIQRSIDSRAGQNVASVPSPLLADALRMRLTHGDLRDSGDHELVNDGFTSPDLNTALAAFSLRWLKGPPDWTLIDPSAAGQPPSGAGHSSAKAVGGYPRWFDALQRVLIERTSWGDDERAAQALLEAFLRARVRADLAAAGQEMPASLEEFFHHVGKSERNKASDELMPGSTKSNTWCAGASTLALVKSLMAHGLRLKKSGSQGTGDQGGRYEAWLNARRAPQVRLIGGKRAWTEPLFPGDKVTLINGGHQGPLTGHVATVIQERDGRVRIVSGNAGGGGGSIRVEEVRREVPPGDYDYEQIGAAPTRLKKAESNAAKAQDAALWTADKIAIQSTGPFSSPTEEDGATTAAAADSAQSRLLADRRTLPLQKKTPPAAGKYPNTVGVSWVVVIERSSLLDANHILAALDSGEMNDVALSELGLEQIPPDESPPLPKKKP